MSPASPSTSTRAARPATRSTFEAVPGNERYFGIVDGNPYFASIGAGASEPFDVFDFGAGGTGADDQGVQIRVDQRQGRHRDHRGPGQPLTDQPRTTARGPRHRRGPRRFRGQAGG